MILLVVGAAWILTASSLVAGLCIAARDGDRHHNRPTSPDYPPHLLEAPHEPANHQQWAVIAQRPSKLVDRSLEHGSH